MMRPRSLLDELRSEYEQSCRSSHEHTDVEGFHDIDARMRKAFRWLENAIAYLDGIKRPIKHVFDLGHGISFEAPRFGRGCVTQHIRRIVGFPVLDEISIYYEIASAKALTVSAVAENIVLIEKRLNAEGLPFTCRRVPDAAGIVRECVFSVPAAIPAAVCFRADYQTSTVTITMVNVDRFDRVSLAFPSRSIDEPILEDLIRFMLGRDMAFLGRAPLTGIHGVPRG
jgi:hypothetical protein